MEPRFAVLRHLKALQNKDSSDAAYWLANEQETLGLFDSLFNAFPPWEIRYADLVATPWCLQIHTVSAPGLKQVL